MKRSRIARQADLLSNFDVAAETPKGALPAGGLKPLMSPNLILEGQRDAGDKRACWNRTTMGPMRGQLRESFTDWNPEQPCGNEACWRHGATRRPVSATRHHLGRAATYRLMALHQRLQGAAR